MASLGRLRRALGLALLVGMGTAVATEPASRRDEEVRILIDVSGSMKKSDPQNLRAPALRLLVNLLPPDSRAGAWSFGQYVNPLVAVEAVDPGWRQLALAAADRIHSRGLYTDIGAALTTATRDWLEPDPATRRSIILLTDGVVDISKDTAVNTAARRAVIEETIPRLRAGGVELHTIALSAKADAELLKTLATATGGGYAQTDSADELQRVFLHMFERAVNRDSLPLIDNRFQVDPSIEEVTLLVFRDADAPATRVQPPSGPAFGLESKPVNTRWHSEPAYDLITIKKPESGSWQLLAAIDDDNRAMIVTDLELRLNEIPNNLLQGEPVPLRISLSENGETITRADFLQLLTVRVRQQAADAAPRDWLLADTGLADDDTAGDGIYSVALGPTLSTGEQELVITVASSTFEREQRRRVRVAASPLTVAVETVDGAPGERRIHLRQAVDWVQADTLRIGARVLLPDGSARHLAVPALPDGGWEASVSGLDPALRYTLELELAGQADDGRAFQLKLPPVELSPALAVAGPPEAGQAAPEPSASTVETAAAKPVNWWLVGTILVTANVAVFGLIGLGVYLLRRRGRLPRIDDPEDGAAEAI